MTAPAFRLLRREELNIVLEWAAAEGWNPGIADAAAFWAADPEGFWGMEHDGKLIGSASIVSYGGQLGFVGLFIVVPEFRGRGYGSAFWKFFIDRLSQRLNPGASAALDGVFAMQAYYGRSGFAFSHRNLRMEGTGVAGDRDRRLIALTDLPFDDVLSYDEAHFCAGRPEFLKHWINPVGGLGLGFIEGGRLLGCGVVRPCRKGFKIGPLFADTPEIAEILFTALSAQAPGQPLFLDIPENNPAAVALAARHGMKEGFGCARMVMGPPMTMPWGNIFGVTTFELG